ncbi:uncharacterized protein EV422DRAFT_570554 [Fimicolochytrium jonesii]|uniref:uncharacterized protein n=1 Tax=Fimicolochytrium jonesii TaxID=1396493 RepID=UPI0022FDD93F|nr:uncharacterized protein EV422DRAFT_570554 [Fimicolochytrium jonesii]KAI8817517.1 hypothetical protein EV422DRAFT_570554 [Fimicolochytrium jonesii]
MDTDSMYMALAGDTIDSLVRPELKEQFLQERGLWLVADGDEYNEKTPGLFKIEFTGTALIALAPKMYFVVGDEEQFLRSKKRSKVSCKGTNKKQNVDLLTYDNFKKVLDGQIKKEFIQMVNKGFRCYRTQLYQYEQRREGLSNKQDKRRRLPDGRRT